MYIFIFVCVCSYMFFVDIFVFTYYVCLFVPNDPRVVETGEPEATDATLPDNLHTHKVDFKDEIFKMISGNMGLSTYYVSRRRGGGGMANIDDC